MKEQERHRVLAFDTLDEVLAYMAEQEAAATPSQEQTAITYGSHTVQIMEDLVVFGYILTQDELNKGESDETVDHLADLYRRGYRAGRFYSTDLLNGEYGDKHVSEMWEITPEDFEDARAAGWVMSPELAKKVFAQAKAAIQAVVGKGPRMLTDEEAASAIGEGLHTGLRKGSDAPSSVTLWNAINDSDDGAWNDALAFLIWGLKQMDIYLIQIPGKKDNDG